MLNDSLVIVLAGGVGERLSPLTRERAKPAVYFGGPYRIIDFTLSNCINAGLRRIFIVTQYKSLSLNRHIRMGWNVVAEELGEFIEILPPQKRVSDNWYLGTADAVYQNLYSVVREAPKHVVILSGDHIYKMDYSKMLRWHIEKGAAATVATYEVPVAGSGAPLRRDPGRRGRADRRLRGEAGRAQADPEHARRGARLDGDLRLRGRRAREGARGRRRPRQQARLRQGHPALAHRPRAGVLVPVLGREQEGQQVLARHRRARRLLRGQHGPRPGQPGLQPVRPGMAHPHVDGAGTAGQVRVRRRRAAAARRSTRSSRRA